MTLSLRHLRYFIAAAESGQVSRAAVELNVSQSTITAAIQHLESQLGAALFGRHPQGVALTLEGSSFLQHARNIIASVNEALRVDLAQKVKVEGNVRVGVTYTVAGYFLPQHLARFGRTHPGVRLKLREAQRSDDRGGPGGRPSRHRRHPHLQHPGSRGPPVRDAHPLQAPALAAERPSADAEPGDPSRPRSRRSPT